MNAHKCPICLSPDSELHMTVTDHSVSQEDFPIRQCQHCFFLYTYPVPGENEIGRYYESEEYISHSGTQKGLVAKLYHIARRFNLTYKYNVIRKHNVGKKLLDYGCGTGEFLKYCQEKGYEVRGVEPNDTARNFALTEHDLNVVTPDQLHLFTNESKDVISLWHVLEHVHRLGETMDHFFRILKPDGNLVVAVPNHISYDARFYKEHWAAYDVPRHLYHFDPETMEKLLRKHGFKLVKINQLPIDSYYVSLLSARYKRGRPTLFGFLEGIFIGWLSNLKANSRNNGYSSLIYIAEKIKA